MSISYTKIDNDHFTAINNGSSPATVTVYSMTALEANHQALLDALTLVTADITAGLSVGCVDPQ